MVDRNLLREFDVNEDELSSVITADDGSKTLDTFLSEGQNFEIGGIVSGKVIEVVGDQVVVDVGYKSEGLVALNEWEDEPTPQPGDEVEVLLEGMEDDTGEIVLSRKKAHRMRAWEMVISKYHEGDVVRGKVTRKIKGGLLVDIGVNVFLPASQVDIRRPSDIADFIDQEIDCMILKIDESRRNIVVSRTADAFEGCEKATSLEEAIALARTTDHEPRIIGGAALYEAALPLATRIFLTEVHRQVDGDVFFHLDRSGWREVERRPAESEGVEFVTLER